MVAGGRTCIELCEGGLPLNVVTLVKMLKLSCFRHKPNQLSHYRRTANHSKRAAVLFMSSVSINTQIHQSLTPSVISFTVLRSSVTQLTLAAEDH